MEFRYIKSIVFIAILLIIPITTRAQESSTAVHVIQPGENLFRIALQYGLTTDALSTANGITDPTKIFAGQALIIPGAANTVVANPVTIEAIQPDNTALPIQPGSGVVIAEAPPDQASVSTQTIYHTIQRGETLRSIARTYAITETDLIQINNIINPDRILAGQQLLINGAGIATTTQTVATAPQSPVEVASLTNSSITHTVQAGEHLGIISNRYNVTPAVIMSANNIIDANRILVGQQLIIPNIENPAAFEALAYPEPGAKVNAGREIVVDLSNSRVYAYENGILMYEAVSSNGLPATPTVQGSFTVRSKVRSQTMSGPGYWLPNVEWVMYFYQGYALHGAYWHNNFGQPMSHGCVNLTNEDALWFYNFAEIGTPVHVQA